MFMDSCFSVVFLIATAIQWRIILSNVAVITGYIPAKKGDLKLYAKINT